ncbi:hypothetical protein llap_20164 [Limosa lapponica baueri]|uniref:Uncharacterized protein n=1 Tax=Limosa lapponica baueri TaxID=1758121 RepID=A0A2I0T6X6_LIMLA|nr:hypothetical protein llap_20164 [Limosa lapponica baueri]
MMHTRGTHDGFKSTVVSTPASYHVAAQNLGSIPLVDLREEMVHTLLTAREMCERNLVTSYDEKFTLEKPVLPALGEEAVILSLLGVDTVDRPVRIALMLEAAVEPLWSRCSALEGMAWGQVNQFSEGR